jgi:4-alpha-glucanotransferase
MRASGVLLPIASLPSKYGIGSFSKSAYDFIDCLRNAGQKYWQILPIGPTGYGDSPYQSFSTFAGNPYFIDPDELVEEGLLTVVECESYDFGTDLRYIDYEKIYISRFDMLRKAYERSSIKSDREFMKFKENNAFWLPDYALYMAIKDSFGGLSIREWPEDIKLRREEAIAEYTNRNSNSIEFYEYIQYLFSKQWTRLKKYANDSGVQLIGDIPIYVAYDSADTWAHPELFQLDEALTPMAVAGCPPDAFSADGQLWGNPLYCWEYHKTTDYEWWLSRISYSFQLYDIVRIDHFKGFDEYFSIPFGEETARDGHWEKGPGYEFFQLLQEKLGNVDIIAEDLGYITESVRKLLERTGYPGMKVLEFAFDSRETNDYLPHNYEKNCVVYTGTHDNDTVLGWFDSITKEDRKMALSYLNVSPENTGTIHWDLIRLAMQSVANTCIVPMQDFLGLNKEARINIPSTVGNNWKWRLLEGEFTPELAKKIRNMTKLYGRCL